jgi:hypothetical protein
MITGCNNPNLSVKKYYNADDLTRIIRNFIVNNGGN